MRHRWHTMHVSCLDVPRAQGHLEDIKAKYGDASNAYRVRVLGEFPTSDDETVIPLELVLGAVGRNVSTLDYHPVWGVDVARFGDDRTALAKRQKNKLLEPVKSWNSTDLMATAGKIKAEYDATPYDARPSEILVDIIGLGAGVYDRCKELGLPVRGVNVGEGAASRENCARLRDELLREQRAACEGNDRQRVGQYPHCPTPLAPCETECKNRPELSNASPRSKRAIGSARDPRL